MSGLGASVPGVRSGLVRAAMVAVIVVAAASIARSEWMYSHRGESSGADPGIVLAPKVASVSTASAVLINVTAPSGQPPGVVYTVSRVTRTGLTTVCTGPAPLRCTDTGHAPGEQVSYTVRSTRDGLGSATTTVDVVVAVRTPPPGRPPSRAVPTTHPTRPPAGGGAVPVATTGADPTASGTPTTSAATSASTSADPSSSPSASTGPAQSPTATATDPSSTPPTGDPTGSSPGPSATATTPA